MKISVLMTVFNGGKYLAQSIESVLNQSFSSFEFIIVDDASTDNTPAILQNYANKDNRIIILHNENRMGPGYSSAKGVAVCKGEFIFRIDADDICMVNRFEKQLETVTQNPPLDVIGSWAEVIDEKGKSTEIRKMPVEHEKIKDLIWTCPFIHSSIFIKKEALQRAGGYNPSLKWHVDYDLWFRCRQAGLQFYNIPKPLVQLREYPIPKTTDFKKAYLQLRVGLKGSIENRMGIKAYFGVFYPMLNFLVPNSFLSVLLPLKNKLDPRNK